MIYYKLIKIFDIRGEDGAYDRNRRLVFSIFTSVLAKFIAIGSTLITMPLTLNYLGTEMFGVWMVISGVIGFLVFSDLGIGMGLQNALSKCIGQRDEKSPKFFIADAYIILTLVASLISVLICVFFSVFPIYSLFNLKDEESILNSVLAMKYSLLAFTLGMPISLIQRVLNGLQKTYKTNLIMLTGSFLSLFAIFLSVYLDLGIIVLSVLFIVAPIMSQLVYSIFFYFNEKELMPRISNFRIRYLKQITAAGIWTVLVQIIYSAKMNLPTILIASTLGLIAVAEFSIVQKLTALVATMITMALQPLWVVYGEAYHSGDKSWIEFTLRKSLSLVFLLTSLAAIIFQFFGQDLIEIWIGDSIQSNKVFIGIFSLWMIASTLNVALTMLMNGTNNFRTQAKLSFIFVVFGLFLIYYFAPIYGIKAVVFIMFAIMEMCLLPFYIIECRKIINNIDVKS